MSCAFECDVCGKLFPGYPAQDLSYKGDDFFRELNDTQEDNQGNELPYNTKGKLLISISVSWPGYEEGMCDSPDLCHDCHRSIIEEGIKKIKLAQGWVKNHE